jgi:hypothetical protein
MSNEAADVEGGHQNSRYDHAFAVVRANFFDDPSLTPADLVGLHRITVIRVVWSQRKAQEEVQRLNELNGDKGCVYFSCVTRIEPRSERT